MNENCLILNILHVWPPGCYRNGQNIKKLFEPSDLAIELAARHCCLKSRVSKVYIRPNPLCQMPQLGVARVFDDGPAKGKGERGRLSKTIVTLSLHHPHHTLGHMWSHSVKESRNVVDTVGRRCQQEFICFYCQQCLLRGKASSRGILSGQVDGSHFIDGRLAVCSLQPHICFSYNQYFAHCLMTKLFGMLYVKRYF